MTLLFLGLVLRAVIGGYLSADCQNGDRVKIAGKISDIYQKGSDRFIRVGNFEITNDLPAGRQGLTPYYLRTQKVVVIGRCERRVTDFLLNKITLIEPKIQLIDEKTFDSGGLMSGGRVLREKLVAIYQKHLTEPEASLVAGIVLGVKSSLPAEFYQKLINTGTIHIVVASGYNLSVVGEMMFYILIYFVSRKWATMGVIGGMIFYAYLTGFGIPVMRALIMASLVLINKALGRDEKTFWWLFLSVWLMLMVKIDLVTNISFQLSVAATLGLVVVEPWMKKILIRRVNTPSALRASPPNLGGDRRGGMVKLPQFIITSELLPTLSAQILTAPLIWWHFGRLSWISPLVNLIVLPLVPPIMLLGVLALPVGGIFGGVFSWLVVPILYSLTHLFVIIIQLLGK